MHMKRVTLIAVMIAGCAAVAGASTFNNPPESSSLIPSGGWAGSFPYQRNALIDLSTNPDDPINPWPDDPVQGFDLVPGVNYDIEGTFDSTLYPSDWIDATGDSELIEWFDTDPGNGPRTGLIGMVNQENASATITWHLDNLPEPRPVKHLWFEMDYYIEGSGSLNVDGISQYQTTRTLFQSTVLDDGWNRLNCYLTFEPNPEWEELSLTLSVDPTAGGTVLIDYMHVATECVPEPASLALLAFGGLLIRRKNRT